MAHEQDRGGADGLGPYGRQLFAITPQKAVSQLVDILGVKQFEPLPCCL